VLSDGVYLYEYDDEGNLTRKEEIAGGKVISYQWDDRNRLSRVNLSDGSVVEYGYDASDRRVSKKVNGVVGERYVYDGDDLALVVDAAGTIVERYLYGAGVDNVLSVERGNAVTWSLADRQGSVVDLVDVQGNVLNHFVYDSFGNRSATTAADFRFGYTGRELDGETGLYYYRARYYDPSLGRFISEDPIGFSAGDTNLYRYVSNSPTNFTDPSGTVISGWAEDALYAADAFFAGFGNVVSFGITNQIRSTNRLAVENQQGGWYNLGSALGLGASLALNPAAAWAKGATWGKGAASAYQGFGTAYGVVDGAKNVLTGQGSAWDLLNLAPAAGFAFNHRKAIGGALLKAGDSAADAAWRGIDRLFGNNNGQRLVLAGESNLAAMTGRIDDVAHSPSFMAMDAGGSSSGIGQGRGLPSEIGGYTIGREIGSGGFGTVLDLPDHPELAIKIATQSNAKANKQLANEANNLRLLKEQGYNVPYIGFIDSTDSTGAVLQGIIMKKIDGVLSKQVLKTGKFQGTNPTTEELGMITQKTISDLKDLRKIAESGKLVIDDLQFMIDRAGSIHVIDPARVKDLSMLKNRQAREERKNFLKRIDNITSAVSEVYNNRQ
jgi:RHS repeat-associated protein